MLPDPIGLLYQKLLAQTKHTSRFLYNSFKYKWHQNFPPPPPPPIFSSVQINKLPLDSTYIDITVCQEFITLRKIL